MLRNVFMSVGFLLIMTRLSMGQGLDIEDKEFWGHDGFSKDEITEIQLSENNNHRNIDLSDYEKSVVRSEEEFFNMSKSEITDMSHLKDIELLEKIENLKNRVFELKSRLFLLSEATLKSKIVSSGIKIEQVNSLSHLFRGETATYLLDGKEIFTDVFIEKEMPSRIPIINKLLAPGIHELRAQINFTGQGKGIYSYLQDYVFSIKARKKFRIREGKRTFIRVSLVQAGSFMTNIKNRIKINYEFDFEDIDQNVMKDKLD